MSRHRTSNGVLCLLFPADPHTRTRTTDLATRVPHQSAWETYTAERDAAWEQAQEWAMNYLHALPAHCPKTQAWLEARRLPADHGPRLAVAALVQYQERVAAAWERYMAATAVAS